MSRYNKILEQWEDENDNFFDDPYQYIDTREMGFNQFLVQNDDGRDNLFDMLTDRIAVGRAPWYPKEYDQLVRARFTHVIDARSEGLERGAADWNRYYPHMNYLWAGFDDDMRHKPITTFQKSLRYGVEAHEDPTAKIFIHCAAGMNRGPSVAYGVLRAVTGLSPDAALGALRAARPIAYAPYRFDVDDALRAYGLLGS